MGDESALPAIFAMTEALPGDADATVVLEVPDPSDEQDLGPGPDPADLAAPARTARRVTRRAAGEAAEVELLPGRGQAYLFGEAKVVLALREVLPAAACPPDQMSPRPTGAAAAPTPATASPPATPSSAHRMSSSDRRCPRPDDPNCSHAAARVLLTRRMFLPSNPARHTSHKGREQFGSSCDTRISEPFRSRVAGVTDGADG